MKDPNIVVRIVHSESKPAWNIVGAKLGGKYKIARLPYVLTHDTQINIDNKNEAYEHAKFIEFCFNNSHIILKSK